MTNKARIAVIGTGWWATSVHLPALLANASAELVAICDADPGRLQAAAQAYAIDRAYTDHHEMLEREQIDGVIIATPHATHYPLARGCLSRGLHVLIEKPMTLYAAHARELVLLAREQRRELLIGYPWNYTRPSNLDLQIHCAGGAILIDMIAATASIRRHDGSTEEVRLSAEESPYPSDAPAANLVDIVLGRAANGSPAEPGWRTVELLDAAYRSAQAAGQPVAVADLYDASGD